MKDIQQLTLEITRLTTHIAENYPELYPFLEENPMTLPDNAHPEMNVAAMQDYLNSLKEMVQAHLATPQREP